MKFSADRGTLMNTLAKAQGIADKKGTVSNVLAHILMESVDDGTIRVKCTDYDVVLLTSFPAKIEKGGKIAINARSFYDSLRLWQDATVDVEALPGGNVQCQCGRTKANLMSFDPEDFPLIEKEELGEGVTMPARLLSHLAQRMIPFMSDDPSRMNLNGMLIKLRKVEETADGQTGTVSGWWSERCRARSSPSRRSRRSSIARVCSRCGASLRTTWTGKPPWASPWVRS